MKKYLLLMLTLVVSTMAWAAGSGTKEDPEVLTASQTFTMPGNSGWTHYYFTYTCELTGTLNFSGYNYFQVGVNEDTTGDETVNNQNISVTEGETYTLDLFMYGGDEVKITLPHVVKDGDWEKPFSLTAGGSVTMNSAAGSQWATYAADKDGKLTLSAAQGLVTSIKVFKSKEDAEYYKEYDSEYYVLASAESNSLSFGVTAGNTYYVEVVKISAPAGNSFSCAFAEWQPGEDFNAPIVFSESPYTAEVAAGATKWYKTTVAVGADMLFQASSASTDVKFTYYDSAQIPCGTDVETNPAQYECIAAYDATDVYVKVENAGTAEASFTVTYAAPAEGETKTAAIKADPVPYSATVAAGTAKWFYVNVPEGKTQDVKVEAAGADIECYDYFNNLLTSATGSVNYKVTAEYYGGTDVYVKVTNNGTEEVALTINAEDHVAQPGETMETAIDVTETGVYTFDASTTDVWVKYTAAEDGLVKIASDVDYNWNNNLQYYAGEEYMGYLDGENQNYEKEVTVTAGTTYYVHATIIDTAEGRQITFTKYVPKEGESYTTAIQVYANKAFAVPAGKTVWYKFEATTKGWNVTFSPSTYSGINGKIFNSKEKAAEGNGYNIDFYWGWDATPYTEVGMNYFYMQNSSEADITVTLSGDITTGINEVNAENTARKAQMFNLAGQRVSNAKGVVIMNGKKVVR